MRKKLLILIGILVGVYIVLTFLDKGEYRVEKQLWRVQKDYAVIAQDPKTVPEIQFDRVIRRYRKLIRKYPDSIYLPQMYSSIGMLNVMRKDYKDAREVFQETVERFANEPEIAAKAMVDVGNTYLAENNIEKAVEVYRRVHDDYLMTEAGFFIPMHIADIYRNLGETEKFSKALDSALRFYQKTATDTEFSDAVRLNAYQLLLSAYARQGEWQKALGVAKTMLYDFADSKAMNPQRLSGITRLLNLVAIVRLQDFDAARKIYSDFIAVHPDHVLNPYLNKVLESLNFLEQNSTKPGSPQN